MTPDRWKEVKDILDEVLQCPPEKQSARLEARCGDDASLRAEVESLLEAEASVPAFLDEGAGALGFPFLEDAAGASLGPAEQVGPYRLVEEIGSGGMGIVYRAERVDGHFERVVALKVLPRYFETTERVARFRAERQILASFSHPNIARLLDGGVTAAGHPYLVMEYVEGVPITEYCTERDVPLRTRIRLLKTVGQAVHHAHSNLVVHRDLKPSNILVTETGTVKLLDFGIAKLLNPDIVPSPPPTTGAGQFLMTPEYAAPEQVCGEDVTTTTDVYQLGVLAYELLTGTRPFPVDTRRLYEIERAVLNTRPKRPSEAVVQAASSEADRRLPRPVPQCSQYLQGDLDDVVMKALRKEPSRRYASVEALADDLNRVLTNRPIRAKPTTVGYRFQKLVQRNRSIVMASLAGVLLLSILSLLYTLQIQTERDRARAEAQKSEEVTSFLMDLFEANAPSEARGDTITAGTLLNRGLERADALDDQPEVQAQMFDVVGQIYGRLGDYEHSESALRRAVRIRTRVLGPTARETVESREHLGIYLGEAGQYEAAERTLRDVLDTRESILQDDAFTLVETKHPLAYSLRRQGKYKEARALLEQSLSVVESRAGERSERAISIKSSLGVVLQNLGHYHESAVLYRAALAERRRQIEPPHPKLATSLNNLASLLMNVGELEEAQSLFREALTMREALFGPEHPKVALTLNNLALVHRQQENYEAAEPLFREALSIRREQLGNEHLSIAISLYSLAGLLRRTDRPRSALEAYQKALALFRKHLGPEHSFVARARMGVGSAHHDLGHTEQAAEALHEGFDRVRQIHADSSLEYALEASRLGRFHLEEGNSSRAERLLQTGLSTLQAFEKSTTPRRRKMERHLERLVTDSTASLENGRTRPLE